MNTTTRYLLVVFGAVIGIHYILSFTHEEYGRATAISNFFGPQPAPPNYDSGQSGKQNQGPDLDKYILSPGISDKDRPTELAVDKRRANATFVILARNSDADGTVRSIREMEDRFNRNYNYPYVLLNEEEFSDDFKRRVSVLARKVEFGVIPKEHWYQPDSIDEEKATAERDKMVADNIIYGGSLSYRNMCRFNSGFFFKHPLMEKYRWYWRIEPDVHFHCDVTYDPFLYMMDHNKIYGFTITMYEFVKTIPTLWDTVKDFMKLHPEFVSPDNSMGYMSDNNGESYNLCHFWSNFEIADMDFWRGPAYQAYFEYLDKKGGFYYERWGDAPVHSIAVGLFAKKEQIHFFSDMGYEHNPYIHCPKSDAEWTKGRCSCNQERNFDYDGYSCMKQWERLGLVDI